MRWIAVAGLTAWVMTGSGCGGDDAAPLDAGPMDAPMGDDAQPAADVGDAASFTMVYNIFSANCGGSNCHLQRPAAAGLNMTDKASAYEALVDQPADGPACRGEGTRVVPMDPDGSLLVSKLEEARPLCGSRMPLGMDPLTTGQIDMVRSWIAAGARND